jgi:hypothetical protein
MSINVQDVSADFNKFSSTFDKKIKELAFGPSIEDSIAFYARMIPNVPKAYVGSSMFLSEISSPAIWEWNAKGTVYIKPCVTPVRDIQINVSLKPDYLRSTYQSFQVDPTKEPKAQAFVTTISQRIADKAMRERELKMFGKGDYDIEETDAKNSMDGIIKLMTAGTGVGGRMFKIQTPAITNSNAFDVIESFVSQIPEEVRDQIEVFCDPQTYSDYLTLKRAELGQNMDYNAKDVVIFPSMAKLNKLICLSGTRTLFATIKQNIVIPYNTAGRFFSQPDKYDVNLFYDYSMGIGFEMNECVFVRVNEVEDMVNGFGADTAKIYESLAA